MASAPCRLRSLFLGPVCFVALTTSLTGLITPGAAAAQEVDSSPSFMLFYSGNATQTANVDITRGALEALAEHTAGALRIFTEHRDLHRFPGEPAATLFRDKITTLYDGEDFDAILVFGGELLSEVVAFRDSLWPGVPVVAGGVSVEALSNLDLPSNVRAVASRLDLAGTVQLARLLQPRATGITVFSGSAAFDKSWEETARATTAGITDIPVEFVSGLTLDDFRGRASALDPDTILLILTVFVDAAGRKFTPADVAKQIASVSAAPSYGVYETFLGEGVVGGRIETFETIGRKMAELVVSADFWPDDAPAIVTVEPQIVVDGTQMDRFNLDPSVLTETALVLNREISIWERYRFEIIAIAAILLLQTATIIGLLVQGRYLRRAEREIALRKSELARASRRGHLGELTGAIAHELNQPLTAILADAEAGMDLADTDPVDIKEIRAILGDIADADRRASQIIAGLRRLVGREQPSLADLDLNDIVERTLLLTKSEVLIQDVALAVNLYPGALPIRGNLTQLKQVLLNLLMNAVEAMAGYGQGPRAISISTRMRDDGWRMLTVADTGPGLGGPAEDMFKPFATDKAAGLGLGLSVSRSIMEAHGGTIGFDETVATGTCAVVCLPSP